MHLTKQQKIDQLNCDIEYIYICQTKNKSLWATASAIALKKKELYKLNRKWYQYIWDLLFMPGY